jgi:hypothetical protein
LGISDWGVGIVSIWDFGFGISDLYRDKKAIRYQVEGKAKVSGVRQKA